MARLIGRIRDKLSSKAGESISETLVSLLIASLALVMLAGAISSSSNMIMKSRQKLDSYYTAAESVVNKVSAGTELDDGIIVTDKSGAINTNTYTITYYKNAEFSSAPVISYQLIID